MFKKFITFILEPLRIFTHRGISEKVANFFSKYSYIVYIFALFIAALIIYLTYRV